MSRLQSNPTNTSPTLTNWNTAFPDIPADHSDSWGISRLLAIRESWLSQLKLLRSRHEITNPPTESEIKAFCERLVHEQYFDPNHYHRTGSWPLIPFEGSESDALVDFIYFPSYIAVAYLSLVRQDFPSIARSIRFFDQILRAGMRFITGRRFSGHGYDSTRELIEAIKILSYGKVFTLAKTKGFSLWKFDEAVSSASNEIQRQIEQQSDGEVNWSAIDPDDGYAALKLLQGADSDFEIVRDSLYMDWALRRKTAFSVRLADECGAALSTRNWEIVQCEMKSLLPVIGDQLEELKPKYTVFERHRRGVATESRVLGFKCNVRDVIGDLKSFSDYMPREWFIEHFGEIVHHLKNDIRHALFDYLALEVMNEDREVAVKLVWVDVDDDGVVTFQVKGIGRN